MVQTWDLLLEYESQITNIELYKTYPIAQMLAFVGNALGGKGKGGPPVSQDKVFTPIEMLPWYAQTNELRLSLKYGGTFFTPKQAKLLGRAIHAKELPSWALGLIDQYQSHKALGDAVQPSTPVGAIAFFQDLPTG